MASQEQHDKFLQALADLGGSSGNIRLRETLNWAETAYDEVRDELLAAGLIIKGRGRGGSVALAGEAPVAQETQATLVDMPERTPLKPKGRTPKSVGSTNGKSNGTGANLGFEGELFKAADKLRGNMEPSDYKHVALGLIFLKHISDSFEAKHAALVAEDPTCAEDPDEYLAENIFWVPKEARWSHLQANAKQPGIGKIVDDALVAIEAKNESLKGVLPKDYARPALNKVMLGELIDLISGIGLGTEQGQSRDVLGRVYEYFLSQFAGSEGKRGGEFYTPRSVVRVLVNMLEPFKGRVYDPCCGSGGMFVQSNKFVAEHGGRLGDIAIYGQESNYTTWRLCKMNLAVRGIDSDIRWNSEGSFHKDEFKDLRADFILANPPFNDSDWGGDRITSDVRWKYGVPPTSNANFAWIQHFISHLAPNGSAAFVLAIMALSSDNEAEAAIRRRIVDDDLIEAIVTLPDKLFYSTPIQASIWVISRNKNSNDLRDRTNKILFIDASRLGRPESRTHNIICDSDISKIANTFRSWRSKEFVEIYADSPGFCCEVTTSRVKDAGYSLFPAAYIKPLTSTGDGEQGDLLSNFSCKITSDFADARTRRSRIVKSFETFKPGQPLFSGKLVTHKLSDILVVSNEILGSRVEPEILTCTENAGLILQRERFSKRVATENTSKYKTVYYSDIVYNPYLLWAGSIDQCTVVEFGVTSPAYSVFKIKDGFDKFLIGRILKSSSMLHKYDGISIGTVKRRRRAPIEKFLQLEVLLPPQEEQVLLSDISELLFLDITAMRTTIRSIEDFFNLLAAYNSK